MIGSLNKRLFLFLFLYIPLLGVGQNNSVGGTLCYPSEYIPAMTVCLKNITTKTVYMFETDDNQRFFQFINIPEGNYVSFTYNSNRKHYEGGYTYMVPCGLRFGCDDHRLIVFQVEEGSNIDDIEICDFYYDTIPKHGNINQDEIIDYNPNDFNEDRNAAEENIDDYYFSEEYIDDLRGRVSKLETELDDCEEMLYMEEDNDCCQSGIFPEDSITYWDNGNKKELIISHNEGLRDKPYREWYKNGRFKKIYIYGGCESEHEIVEIICFDKKGKEIKCE